MKRKIILTAILIFVSVVVISITSNLLNENSWAYFFTGVLLVSLEVIFTLILFYNINLKNKTK